MIEVLLHRPAGERMDHGTAHRGGRLQHESPPRHVRMRNQQRRRLQNDPIV